MSEDLSRVFIEGLLQLGLGEQEGDGEETIERMIASSLYQSFLTYRRELLEWNTRFNLTAIKDPEEVLIKHFLDSLSLLQAYDKPEARILDIGSGAGFPGLPLKIVRPRWHVTLLEATGKRITFLQHMIDVLHLTNIEVVQGRAEEIAHRREYRGQFDMVTARAVSSLSALLEYGSAYCRVGGALILPKKGDLADEKAQGMKAGGQVGVKLKADIPVQLPGLADGRRLLIWEQQKDCPPQFPRNYSAMTKKPLG